MTVAGFLIALGASVLLVSAVSLFWGTILELCGENPLTGRTGVVPLAEPEASEVHDLPCAQQA